MLVGPLLGLCSTLIVYRKNNIRSKRADTDAVVVNSSRPTETKYH